LKTGDWELGLSMSATGQEVNDLMVRVHRWFDDSDPT